ncbi:OmpA family protein [Roseobacter sp. YSTF-M11]|uniref:OmpA family protein n=1 Tax=Roseobacter insulae TaxID=2859783 RepID=A0A9X1FY08_9RHOB|nr:OmpA family protein [Roseobacter insulae]MBW4709444.1 OmpA family protein [Roseobacter insulae]
MKRQSIALTTSLLLSAGNVVALDLAMPAGARLTVERATPVDSFDAPIGAFSGEGVPFRVLEGAVNRRAWRIGTAGLTVLQVMAPLREQIEAQGFTIAFECAATACGGFDFRFGIEVLPGPNMYVNIGSYRYLTAFRGPEDNPTEAITVLASVTSDSAYVQVIEAVTGLLSAVPDTPEAAVPDPVERPGGTPVPGTFRLLEDGFVILRDLDFRSGTSELGAGPYPSLDRLAEVLASNLDLRVALVGHTDTVGALDPNIALSRQRAQAVRTRLIDDYGVDPARLDAEGMGYLSPVASNQTAEGRNENRRVEAIVLNSE